MVLKDAAVPGHGLSVSPVLLRFFVGQGRVETACRFIPAALRRNRVCSEQERSGNMYTYPELLNIIAELRSEHGCPWDRAQTHESMIPCLKDECQEVIDAIIQKDDENLCEELGDVLLQVLLHAQIAKEEGRFTMENVVDMLAEKMVRRHPHVFGNEEYGSSEQNQKRWEEIKQAEKEMKKRRRNGEI